jgi:two-component system chemotaxis response regulator CheY
MCMEVAIGDLLLEAELVDSRGLTRLEEVVGLAATDGAAAHKEERPPLRTAATVRFPSQMQESWDAAVTATHTPRPSLAAIGSAAKQRVLVVEGSRAIANALKYFLEIGGFDEIGLEMAKRELPNVVVTDYDMSGMDRLTMVRALRADASTRRIAVLMPTSEGGVDKESLALDARVNDHNKRPVEPRDLAARVKCVLARAKDRRFVVAT